MAYILLSLFFAMADTPATFKARGELTWSALNKTTTMTKVGVFETPHGAVALVCRMVAADLTCRLRALASGEQSAEVIATVQKGDPVTLTVRVPMRSAALPGTSRIFSGEALAFFETEVDAGYMDE